VERDGDSALSGADDWRQTTCWLLLQSKETESEGLAARLEPESAARARAADPGGGEPDSEVHHDITDDVWPGASVGAHDRCPPRPGGGGGAWAGWVTQSVPPVPGPGGVAGSGLGIRVRVSGRRAGAPGAANRGGPGPAATGLDSDVRASEEPPEAAAGPGGGHPPESAPRRAAGEPRPRPPPQPGAGGRCSLPVAGWWERRAT
jgi:hypothetical protein